MSRGEETAPPAPDVALLTEIRDLLARQDGTPTVRGGGGLGRRLRSHLPLAPTRPCGAGSRWLNLDRLLAPVRSLTHTESSSGLLGSDRASRRRTYRYSDKGCSLVTEPSGQWRGLR